MIKWLNNYFFDEDEISLSDGLWFYGLLGGFILWAIYVVFIA